MAHHFKFCQPDKPAYDSGFVLCGCLPNLNQDEFKMTLALIQSGATDTGKTYEPLAEIQEQDTVSDEELNLQEPP